MGELSEVIWPFATEAKAYEKFSIIPFDFTLSANQTSVVRYEISSGWDFTVAIINSFSSGAFSFNVKDRFTDQDFFINKTRGTIASGNGQKPFVLPKLHTFSKGSAITVECTDLSGSSNTIQLALIGYKEDLARKKMQGLGGFGDKVSAKRPQMKIDGDVYIIDRPWGITFDYSIASGSSDEEKFPVSNGANFMWEAIMAYNDATSPRDFTLQIRDELLTEDMFTSPLRSSVICGNGQNPFILPRPYLFQGGSTILTTAADTSTGSTITAQVCMLGYRVIKA